MNCIKRRRVRIEIISTFTMAKGLLFVAFTACLLVSGHALLPVGEILGGVTGAVGGLTGAVTNVITDTVPQLTKTLEGLIKTVLDIVKQVLDLVLKLVLGVVDALQKALQAPLNAVLGVVDSLTKGLLPGNLADALKSALKLDAVTDLVKQLTGTVTCLLDKVVGNLTSEVLKGVVEILKCANPLVKEVGNVTKAVEVLVKDTLNVAKDIVQNITKCISTVSGADVLPKIVNCLLVPLGNGVQELSKIIAKTTPKIQQALDVAVKALQCIQDVLVDKLNKAGAILKSVADCASGNKVPEIQPELPNFTKIAKAAIAAINDAAAAAVGSDSALNMLFQQLNKFKAAADAASPAMIQAIVNKVVADAQAQIAEFESLGADANCVAQAKTDLMNLATTSMKSIEADVASIAPDATKLITQSAELDFELKKEVVEAAANALTACSQFASATDNSAQMCFDKQVQDVKSRIAAKVESVKAAVQTAMDLTAKTEAAVMNGKAAAVKGAEDVVSKFLACLG